MTNTYNSAFRRVVPIPPWEWAAQQVDYGRVPAYDTPYKGPFDPGLLPFWREPLAVMRDPGVREVVVCKCSRAGFSENLVLTDLRYTIARAPEPTLYVTGKMDLAKGFLDRRVRRGMRLSPETDAAYRHAREVGQDIQFRTMDFRATWSTSDTAVKQDGWARVYADEVGLWAEFTVDMLRRRCSAYPFHHILYGGSLNPEWPGPPDQDPIWKLWMESDRREWFVRDPGTSNLFRWQLSGVRWDGKDEDDANTDLDRVRQTAHYVTPDGTRIEEVDRMVVARDGQWVATAESSRPGFRVVAPMVPFHDCTFGELGARFVSAAHRLDQGAPRVKRRKNTLRTYAAEYWAEISREEPIAVRDLTLRHAERGYALGDPYPGGGVVSATYLAVDVQQKHLWYVSRVVSPGKNTLVSALYQFGTLASFGDLDDLYDALRPAYVAIDARHRAAEVVDWCCRHTPPGRAREACVFAVAGSDQLKHSLTDLTIRDAYEGKAAAGPGRKYAAVTWQTDYFRTWFVEAVNGTDSAVEWVVPAQHGRRSQWAEYVKQITSTRRTANGWEKPSEKYPDHMWDCEVMLLVLSYFVGAVAAATGAEEPEAEEPEEEGPDRIDEEDEDDYDEW